MAKYMIHAYPKRMWYVEGYIVPSLIAQGIPEENITVWNDTTGEGTLMACMNSFKSCEGDGGTWHLQDDVAICSDFKARTEWYDNGLVCGFSSLMYDGDHDRKKGAVHRKNMWFSFPCIRIPDPWARECAQWVMTDIIGNPVYKEFWEKGRNADWAFRQYLQAFHRDCIALNIMPNLVDHVDYLLGGGSGGQRKEPCRAQYWIDDELIEQLEKRILKNNKK